MSPMLDTLAVLLRSILWTVPANLLTVVFAVSIVAWLVLVEEVDLRRNRASVD